jgi:hypothetical protein
MTNRPFAIFPKIGYRNSQFQVMAKVDDLTIDIYSNGRCIKSITANTGSPITIMQLEGTGQFIAKCVIEGMVYEQDIEIRDAYRIGTSVFKKAFVFEDTKYSFFLMKDRLLLYDEEKKILLTENHYSPTEIHKIDKEHYLFITDIGTPTNGITNLGIYSTESFSTSGEILDKYQKIKLLPENNIVWVFDKSQERIKCLTLIGDDERYFVEIVGHDGFLRYYINESQQRIYIDYQNKVVAHNISDPVKSIEIRKCSNCAIDKYGYIYTIIEQQLICTNTLDNYKTSASIDFDLSLTIDKYFHVGSELRGTREPDDFNDKIGNLKNRIVTSIPENEKKYKYILKKDEAIFEAREKHVIYATTKGLFLFTHRVDRAFSELHLTNINSEWKATPWPHEKHSYSLRYLHNKNSDILVTDEHYIEVRSYIPPALHLHSYDKHFLLKDNNKITIKPDRIIKTLSVCGYIYTLILDNKEKCLALYTDNFAQPELKDIDILNLEYIEKHQTIWHLSKDKKYIHIFDLRSRAHAKSFTTPKPYDFEIKFHDNYGITPKGRILNPTTPTLKSSFVGDHITHSDKLNKIVSRRENHIYLSIYRSTTNTYEPEEIELEEVKYNESYLSPDGKYLVLHEDKNQYILHDIENGENIKFISGKFIAFSSDGNLIIEENNTRSAIIIDPITFQDITPSNYHHYRFSSTDGRLYAQVVMATRYVNKISGQDTPNNEAINHQKELDYPGLLLTGEAKRTATTHSENKKRTLLAKHPNYFKEHNINSWNDVTFGAIYETIQYTEIGIAGTNIKTEIRLPNYLLYYNYSAFSCNNEYFAYVGKSKQGPGVIGIFKIDLCKTNQKLATTKVYESSLPKKAAWVCSFSNKGHFATYDSEPNTYIVDLNKETLNALSSNYSLEDCIDKAWGKIEDKNHLCFSHSGDFMALSEQGYDPITLGGYGHQESNVVHISTTDTREIIDSFTGHGDRIKIKINSQINNQKDINVIFVAFSDDEKKIMTLSKDGVVFVRNITAIESFRGKQGIEQPLP